MQIFRRVREMIQIERMISKDVHIQIHITMRWSSSTCTHSHTKYEDSKARGWSCTQNHACARCYPRAKYPSLSHLSQKSLHFLLHHCFELIQAIRKQADGRVPFGGFESGDPRLEVVGFHPQVQTRHYGHN